MLDKFADPKFLKESQYKTADNLNARMLIHQRFSTNEHEWHPWVFDHVNIQAGHRVLEAGGGPGKFWSENLERVPDGVKAVLTDFSFGMVKTASELKHINPNFSFMNMDIMSIPFEDNCFDRVIGNHMLYHVPDIEKGVREAAHVLKADGIFVAATNGENHMKESFALVSALVPDLDTSTRVLRRFNVTNAADYLKAGFHSVERIDYPDALKVTDCEILIRYLLSMWAEYMSEEQVDEIRKKVASEIKTVGYYHIQKETAVFLAREPKF